MRSILTISVVSAALLVTSCKSASTSASSDPAASGEVNSAAAFRSEIGGQLLAIGDHKVELRVFENGHAEALVLDARGKAVEPAANAKVTIHAKPKGGADARATIDLAFDPTELRFVGKPSGKIDLEPAPIDVDLSLDGTTKSARLDAPVLLVGPEIGGTLAAAGKYGVELAARGDGSVEALVHDAAGARVTGDSGLKLEARLATTAGTPQAVTLAWDAPKARFSGRFDGTAKLAAGPAELAIDGAACARLPKLALRADAAHGGRVIVAGDYSVELVANAGVVRAFVFDASGAAVANGELDLSLKTPGGGFVKLAWDPPSLGYRADANVDLATMPVTVAVKAGAKAFVGASVPKTELNGDARANVALDVPKPNIDAHALANANAKAKLDAKANVKAPSVTAKAAVKPVSVSASKSASASAGAGAGAAANAKAGFSFGTK